MDAIGSRTPSGCFDRTFECRWHGLQIGRRLSTVASASYRSLEPTLRHPCELFSERLHDREEFCGSHIRGLREELEVDAVGHAKCHSDLVRTLLGVEIGQPSVAALIFRKNLEGIDGAAGLFECGRSALPGRCDSFGPSGMPEDEASAG